MLDFLFTREMVDGWQHSEECLNDNNASCSCGLTALRGEVGRALSRARSTFYVNVIPAITEHGVYQERLQNGGVLYKVRFHGRVIAAQWPDKRHAEKHLELLRLGRSEPVYE